MVSNIFDQEHPLSYGVEVDPLQLELGFNFPPVPLYDQNGYWQGYPQSLFPNWTHRQVVKSRIRKAITESSTEQPCICHRLDVDTNGLFTNAGPMVANHGDEQATWERLISETVSGYGVS